VTAADLSVVLRNARRDRVDKALRDAIEEAVNEIGKRFARGRCAAYRRNSLLQLFAESRV
jgi:hypothetical protein